jgi:outer membrane protein OmpA-like peptidoglycan-associated protein
MSDENLQEWEEYDSRLLHDTPVTRVAPESETGMRLQPTSAVGSGDLDSPFLLANACEVETESEIMEGERQGRRSFHRPPRPRPPRRTAVPSGYSCNCDSADDTAAADAAAPDDGQSSESEAWASEATVLSGAREVDPYVKRARFMVNKPVPGVPGTTIGQLVDKWRVRIAPEIPLPILIAFMTYESAGFEDATHGTAKNAYTSPPFYELGLFQTPAGLHGHCSSGDYRSCEFSPPGKEDPHDPSEWHKLCQQISGGCKDWKDPETQVQVGLKNLENTATSIRRRFKDLFTDPGSDWDLRAAVLLPFAGGAGFARHFLAEYQVVSKTLDDQSWERLGQMTFVRQPGGTGYILNSMGVWRNVNEKMALAAKLGYQPRQSSVAKEIETQLEVPDLQAARNSPAVQQLIKFENIKKYRPGEWRDALAVAQSYWSDPFLENFWKIREAENNSSLSLAEHGGLRFSIQKKALSDLITEAAKKRIIEHVTGEVAELIFGEGAGRLVGLLGFSLEFLQMARDIENERMLGKVGPEGDKWRKEQIHRFVLGILAEDIARGTDTSPGEISYNLDKQYNRFKAIADKYAEYAQLEHQLAVYGDQIPDRPPDMMRARESEVLLGNAGEVETESEIMEGERQGRRSFHRPPQPRPPRRTAAPSGRSCNCDSTDDTAAVDAAAPDDGQSSESEAWASEATVSEQELAGMYPRSAGFESGEVKPSSAGCPTDRPHVVTGFSQYGYNVRLLPSDQLDKLGAIGQEIKQTAFSGRPGSESERTQVMVVGHADMDAARETREPGFLQYISERRAIAVYDFLLCYLRRKVGVDDSMRVGWKVVGNGARSLAVAKPRTQAERGCNRRVEIVIQRPFEAVPKSSDSVSQWRVVEWPILTDLYETALQGTSGQYTKPYTAVQNAKEISEKAWAAYSRWLDRDCGVEKTGQFVPPIITAGENQDFLRTFKDALQGTASKSNNSNEVVANAFEIAIQSLDLVRQQLRERMEWRHASLPQAMDADCEPGARVPGGPGNHFVCRTHDHILDTTSRTVIAHDLEEYKKNQPVSRQERPSRELEAELQAETLNYGGQSESQVGKEMETEAVPAVRTGTTFVTRFHPGAAHDHKPTGHWTDVQADAEKRCKQATEEVRRDPARAQVLAETLGVECACAVLSPAPVAKLARSTVMAGLILAQQHLDHYLNGSGSNIVEDLADVLRRDAGVRKKLAAAIRGSATGHIRIEQSDYQVKDFQFAFGAIDRVDFEVDRSAGLVHVWFQDRYEWHPVGFGYTHLPGDVRRDTNCVHAAMVELKSSGAKDYWMIGDAVVSLTLITGAPASGGHAAQREAEFQSAEAESEGWVEEAPLQSW